MEVISCKVDVFPRILQFFSITTIVEKYETKTEFPESVQMTKLIYYHEKRMVDTITDGRSFVPTD